MVLSVLLIGLFGKLGLITVTIFHDSHSQSSYQIQIYRVKKFQNKASVRVGILSMTAAGVGLTLTAASTVIFAELHWTPGVLAQAEDRCHRIGQTNAVNIMFCVCKDHELSVDLSLWKMLGRKTSNLGRMIDGKKGLSMKAVDAENGAPSELELSSFFAETCPSNIGKRNEVKGSIQSFFSSKSKHAEKRENMSTRNIIERGDKKSRKHEIHISTECQLFKKKRDFKYASRLSRTTHESKSPASPLSWTCTACTYINEGLESASFLAGLVCRICRTPCDHQPEVIGESNVIKKPKLLSLSQSSDDKHETTGNLRNTKTSLKLEVIEISDDSDEDFTVKSPSPKRQKCQLAGKPRRTLQSSAVICLDLDDPPTQNIHTDCLSFCVSKNSGRISVCDAESGESLLLNFDIEDVIHETTSEEILTKQVKRTRDRHHGLSRTQILFEDTKVEKGKKIKMNFQ